MAWICLDACHQHMVENRAPSMRSARCPRVTRVPDRHTAGGARWARRARPAISITHKTAVYGAAWADALPVMRARAPDFARRQEARAAARGGLAGLPHMARHVGRGTPAPGGGCMAGRCARRESSTLTSASARCCLTCRPVPKHVCDPRQDRRQVLGSLRSLNRAGHHAPTARHADRFEAAEAQLSTSATTPSRARTQDSLVGGLRSWSEPRCGSPGKRWGRKGKSFRSSCWPTPPPRSKGRSCEQERVSQAKVHGSS